MKKLVVLIVLFVVFGVGFFAWWRNGLSAPDPDNENHEIFVINEGAAIRQIGNSLKEEGFITDPVVFFLYLKKEGIDTEIQAGSYRLSPSMTLPQLVETLQHGTIDVWSTIPEGYRAEEVAEVLEANLTSYDSSWMESLRENEGYLFPDTYLIPHDAGIDRVITIMRDNFNRKVESVGINTNNEQRLEEIVTIASLIEREAKLHEDFPYVSSVIQNRLESGMALQLDASAQYALGYSEEEESWWRTPSPEDLEEDSPYNTYVNTGLPPGPIGNPGIDAIQAAANPAESDYLYYVNDENGKLHFAETLEVHNQNIDQYLE